MTKFFRSKPRAVKALQWFPSTEPRELYPCPDTRAGFEDVMYIGSDHANLTKKDGGYYKLHPGDWVVISHIPAGYEVYSRNEFPLLFEPNEL